MVVRAVENACRKQGILRVTTQDLERIRAGMKKGSGTFFS
jgi:hypothetical protein